MARASPRRHPGPVHRLTSRQRLLPALVLAAVAALLPATAGVAAVPDDEAHGGCSGRARWHLEVQPDDGRLRVEGQVGNAGPNTRWTWRLLHDGRVSAKGTARADGGGTVDVDRTMVNGPGTDRVGWRARNRSSGQKCRGGLTY